MAWRNKHSSGGEPQERPVERRVFVGAGTFWGFVVGLVLPAAFVALIVQNGKTVRVNWIVWRVDAPPAAVLLAALIAVLITEAAGAALRIEHRRSELDHGGARSTPIAG